jgi:DNA-binding Lrp family transcriptional regulator
MLAQIDKLIIDELQFRFPLTPRPYQAVANRLSLSEQEVLLRLERLILIGMVRYTGITFDLRSLGFSSTLAALSVPHARLQHAAEIINSYPQVSHNYARTGKYSLWFTATEVSDAELGKLLTEIQYAAGASALLDLRTINVYKSRALFSMCRNGRTQWFGCAHHPELVEGGLSIQTDKTMLRVLSEPFETTARPFLYPAVRLGMSEKKLIAVLRSMTNNGIIRRIGAALNHYKAGFLCNVLIAWNVNDRKREQYARYFSSFDAVSHCYHRTMAQSWPYSLYTMVHGRSRKECLSCIGQMAKKTNISDYRVFFTVKEYKKTKINVAEILQ